MTTTPNQTKDIEMDVTARQLLTDRINGALLGTATGDALGAGYEFSYPEADTVIEMNADGPFGYAVGEWTDDTAMMMAIVTATEEASLDTTAGLDAVANRFLDWYRSYPKDIGNQTLRVLSHSSGTAAEMTAYAASTGHDQAGNGSLMRTAAVAAAFGTDSEPDRMLSAADAISRLTHTGTDTHLACRLWAYAIWWGIRHHTFDGIEQGLVNAIPSSARGRWTDWIGAAESSDVPPQFERPNGWVVSALQTAWWGITSTLSLHDPSEHIVRALTQTVRAGNDTDTTAAIAGGLLGGVHGASAIPKRWVGLLHGWPASTSVEIECHGRRCAGL